VDFLRLNYICDPIPADQLELLASCRVRFCVERGTRCSGTMEPNGMWRMQLDVTSPPRLSASWSLPLTQSQWPSLTSEGVQITFWNYSLDNRTHFILPECICNSILYYVLAVWPASKKLSNRRWRAARQFCRNALMSWRRKVGLEQLQVQHTFT